MPRREYELDYKPLSAVKGQVLPDFLVEHDTEEEEVMHGGGGHVEIMV
jgi:hypothetical protein